MKRIFPVIIVLMIIVKLFSAEGDYQRMSISSVESVWIRPGAFSGVHTFPYSFFEKMIEHYIELPRFDYNELPKPLLEEFRNQANSLRVLTPESIANVLNETVGFRIKELLEDPEIQLSRVRDFKDESWKARFAGSKGASMGLTVDELEKLMNSAYIYLPYISKYEMKKKGDEISVEIEGGIIWYQVKISPDGKIDMVLRVASTTNARGFADKNPKQVMGMRADYTRFRWGSEVYNVTEEMYAQYDALQAWARNLSVKTKEIDEFNISAQIMETRPGRVFGAPIGRREGINLDDGFYLVENYESSDGQIKSKRIGFTRVAKTADNINNPEEMSLFKQYMGQRATVGVVLQEHPRLGIDIRFLSGYQSNMNIPSDYTRFVHPLVPGGSFTILDEDANDQIFFGLEFAYNLAPLTGVSQMFLELESSFGIPMASYTPNVSGSTAYTLGVYGGLSKKFWFYRNSLNINTKFGYDRLVMDGQFLVWNYKYTINAYGIKSGLAYNYMITPDLLLNIGADYKIGFKPTGLSLEFDDETLLDLNSTAIARIYPDLRLGGVMFNLGLSYSFGELPFNIFGWLDPLKRY